MTYSIIISIIISVICNVCGKSLNKNIFISAHKAAALFKPDAYKEAKLLVHWQETLDAHCVVCLFPMTPISLLN